MQLFPDATFLPYGLAAAFFLIILVLALLMMRPSARMRRKLKKKARQDYRTSRGTQHRQIIDDAIKTKQREIRRHQRELKRSVADLTALQQRRSQRLRQALSTHLVNRRLTEIPGIGEGLKQRIVATVFSGDIQDLRRANRVYGIGPARYAQIVDWVQRMEPEMSRLLQFNFPGKQSIEQEFSRASQKTNREIAYHKAEIASLQAQIDQLMQERQSLTAKKKAFVTAILQPEQSEQAPGDLDSYLSGAFSPWESIPDWFKEALKARDD